MRVCVWRGGWLTRELDLTKANSPQTNTFQEKTSWVKFSAHIIGTYPGEQKPYIFCLSISQIMCGLGAALSSDFHTDL